MNAIVQRWNRFLDRPWTKNGRLGFWLIVASCLTTIAVAFLGPSSVTLNVGPANGSLLPPYFIPVEWGERIGLPLSEWVVVPALWVGITIGTVGLLIAWRAVTAGWRPRIHRMFYLGVGLNVATAAVPPLTSADVLMYAAYGRLQRQGVDPYSITPAEIFRQTYDPVLVWTERPWQDTPSVYGPIASFTQWLANVLGGESMHDVVFWLQLIHVTAFIVVCAVMIKLAHGDAALQTRSVLFTILNPLLIWAVVAGAHNEALTLVFAIVALWFMRRSAFVTGIFIGLAGGGEGVAGLLRSRDGVGLPPRLAQGAAARHRSADPHRHPLRSVRPARPVRGQPQHRLHVGRLVGAVGRLGVGLGAAGRRRALHHRHPRLDGHARHRLDALACAAVEGCPGRRAAG